MREEVAGPTHHAGGGGGVVAPFQSLLWATSSLPPADQSADWRPDELSQAVTTDQFNLVIHLPLNNDRIFRLHFNDGQ